MAPSLPSLSGAEIVRTFEKFGWLWPVSEAVT